MVGYHHGATDGRCKFLTYHDERWWCGVLGEMPEGSEKDSLKSEMAIGSGCSSSLLNDWRTKIPTPSEMDAYGKKFK